MAKLSNKEVFDSINKMSLKKSDILLIKVNSYAESEEDMKKSNIILIFGLSFLLNFIIAFFISLFVEIAMMVGTNAIMGGLFAVLLCIGFVGTTFGVNYLFARKSVKLYLIDMGYMVVSFFVMGIIVGAWY